MSGDIGGGGFAYHGQHGSNGPYYPSNPAMVQAATGVPIVMHPQPVTAAYLPTHPAVQVYFVFCTNRDDFRMPIFHAILVFVQVSAASNPPVFQHGPLVTLQSPPAPVVVAAPPAVVVPPPIPIEVVQLPPVLAPVVSPPLLQKVVAGPSPAPSPAEKVATAAVEETAVVASSPVVDKAPEQLPPAAPPARSPEPVVPPTASPEVAPRAETAQQPASSEEPLAESSGNLHFHLIILLFVLLRHAVLFRCKVMGQLVQEERSCCCRNC